MSDKDLRRSADPAVSVRADGAAAPQRMVRVVVLVRRLGVANLALFGTALMLYLAVGLIVMRRLSLTGDEPWYLMQGYALVHYHTPSLTAIVDNPQLLRRFLIGAPDNHIRDYLGNGQQLLPNLPGYGAIVGTCYWLAGRFGIILLQSILSAFTVVLLFAEGRRLYGSRVAALVASIAFAFSLPALLFAAQVFPSAIASSVAFGGFVLAGRMPVLFAEERWTRRRVLAIVGLAGVCGVLPWLHFKYALLSLALLALTIFGMRSLLRARSAPATQRSAWYATLAIAGVMLASFLLVAVYCHVFFGRLTPPVTSAAGASMDLAHPDLARLASLFADMFLNRQSGLLPWVPLDLLVIPGIVVLWQRSAQRARDLLLCLAGALGAFVPALFTTDIYQGWALPSRFTVECAPFFALAAAGVIAAGEPALRRARRKLRRDRRESVPTDGGSPRLVARTLLVVVLLILMLFGLWFDVVGVRYPELLYPLPASERIVARFPNALPGWWFTRFPGP